MTEYPEEDVLIDGDVPGAKVVLGLKHLAMRVVF